MKSALEARIKANHRSAEVIYWQHGLAYSSLGELNRAWECFEERLSISLELNNLPGQLSALGNLGVINRRLGNLKLALENLDRSLIIARKIGDRPAECQNTGNAGTAYTDMGEYKLALRHHKQALAISASL